MFDSLNGIAFWSGQVYLTFGILQCLVLVKADCALTWLWRINSSRV